MYLRETARSKGSKILFSVSPSFSTKSEAQTPESAGIRIMYYVRGRKRQERKASMFEMLKEFIRTSEAGFAA